MKKLLLLSITLLALTVACGKTVDDSQWKSDMEEKIKTLESKKDMPMMEMMEMMHNEEMEEMMGMKERHRDVEELKEKVSALESKISKLEEELMKLKN
jgi:TolA-binding protein